MLAMAKVRIIGIKGCLEQTVETLHRLGMLHIEKQMASLSDFPRLLEMDEDTLAQSRELSSLISRLDALLASLPKPAVVTDQAQKLYESCQAKGTSDLIAEIDESLQEVEHLAQGLVKQREEITIERDALPLPEPKLGALARLKRRLRSLLRREKTAVADLPEDSGEESFEDAAAGIEERREALCSQLDQIEQQMEELSTTWHHKLNAWRAVCRDRLEELEVLSNFTETDYTFMIEGWIPQRSLLAVREALENEVGDHVMLGELELEGKELEEHAPIALDNPAPSKPFEFLIRLLGLPRYGTLDPTAAMSFFLPFFFGLIVGDVAYGIALLALALFLLRRVKSGSTMHSLGMVLAFCAAWTIVFGFFFGEFIGNVGEHLFHMHPLWKSRVGKEGVTSLFILTLSVGAIHILLGLILGVWNALRVGSRSELLERGGMLIAILALLFLIMSFLGYLPQSFVTPIVAVLIVGLVILIASFGMTGVIMGPLELMKTVGNILSYLRIAAIGLASVFLAEVANEMAGAIGNIVLGGIIAGFLHILNIVLGAISPSIQSLRLHYVEFFGKFYEVGGREFTPFRRAGIE